MRRHIILDTGPLVAFLNRNDSYHLWSSSQWREIEAPFFTCESVISEACFLLRLFREGSRSILKMMERGVIEVPFRLDHQVLPISKLMGKYSDVPMSLADACLVRLSEIIPDSTILTIDTDFRVYRKNGKEKIPLILPD